MVKLRTVTLTCALVSASGAVGCKGDDDEGTSFNACGGEVTGSWQVSGGRVDRNDPDSQLELDPACNSRFDSITVGSNGSVFVFTENGTLTTSGSTEFVFAYSYTAACLRAASDGAVSAANAETCNAIASAIHDAVQADDPQNSASCVVAGRDCDCALHVFQDVPSGTYTAEDGLLTIDGDASQYCVDGDMLLVHDETGTLELTRVQ